MAATLAMNSSSGSARAVSRSATSRRPVFHVVISVKMHAADDQRQPAAVQRSSTALAPRNARSIDRNTAVTPSATAIGHFHRSVMTTCSSSAVMTIVSVTAMPYAAASARDERKPITIRMVQISEDPVHLRHVDLAHLVREVCSTSRRGA